MVREGFPFVIVPFAIAVVLAIFGWWLTAAVFILIAAFMMYFFRDPHRDVPDKPGLIISAADGRVTRIDENADDKTVSVFLSPLDVHINRSPISGTVRRIAYIPGKFLNADLDKASEDNERQHFLVESEDGVRIGFTQIAGLVARRIMSFVKEGDRVEAGERIGLIRFGSRVDVFLPAGTGSQVLLGQRTIAGETILGEMGVDPQRRGISQ